MPDSGTGVRLAVGAIAEFAIPLRLLGPGPIAFRLVVSRADRIIAQYPRSGSFRIDIPGPDFDARHWRA